MRDESKSGSTQVRVLSIIFEWSPLSDHSFSFSRKTKVTEFLSPDLTLLVDGYEAGPAAQRNTSRRPVTDKTPSACLQEEMLVLFRGKDSFGLVAEAKKQYKMSS
ncbi:hypothetical protein CDAR_33261 [Caerostris darwini]|uniref:Uncharacterized protein n=1 Tax=Caerostris darwini TaxID=1538125 RepID=A0AAV4X3Q9_9ARAC|nr:hypothetical protein CDAR_33261 [Caerostris darwini]